MQSSTETGKGDWVDVCMYIYVLELLFTEMMTPPYICPPYMQAESDFRAFSMPANEPFFFPFFSPSKKKKKS